MFVKQSRTYFIFYVAEQVEIKYHTRFAFEIKPDYNVHWMPLMQQYINLYLFKITDRELTHCPQEFSIQSSACFSTLSVQTHLFID